MSKFIWRVSIICMVVMSLLLTLTFSVKAEKKDEVNLCDYAPDMRIQGGPDIEAAITNQWGSGAPPIKIFGRNAALGEVVTATLDEYDEKYALRAFEDPLPVHNACPGYGYFRDANMSIISRISIGSWRQMILIRHAGGRGFRPGSEGYIQLLGDEWKIIDVLSDQGPDNSYYGFGLNIDEVNGRIEWQGRGGCPACACLENDIKIAVVVEKKPVGPDYTPFISTRSTAADIEASITHQWGSGAPPLKLFGQGASVGQIVTAVLNEYDQKYALRAFEDPLAVFSSCPYYRDANISFISRITLGTGRVLILIRHHGARGYRPGSEGYVQLGEEWYIEKIVSAGNDNYSYGYGVRIDQENSTIEWQGRTGCPGCACHEGPAFISVVVMKKSNPTISSIEPDSGFIGTTVIITGSAFGSEQGTVTFNGIEADEIISWTDTEIVTKVPANTTTGPVVVHTAELKDSNEVIFTVEKVGAAVDINPNTLNRKSKGKWVTAHIELPEGFDVEEIDINTVAIVAVDEVTLDEPLYAELKPTSIGDYDSDGIPDLMVKFDRKNLINALTPGDRLITLSGELTDGNMFQGSDTIKVIH